MWLDSGERIHAPEIGRSWINPPPVTLSGARGSVVLLDFWDYTCVNCIRTLPYLREWHRRYREFGLKVIGIHTPEFHFARNFENVARAAREFNLDYPIVLDNEYQIWQAYSNRCWPAKYLVDKDGYVRFYHFGEGGYSETESAIQKLLRETDTAVLLPDLMSPVRKMDHPGARCVPVTPELYLGFSRGRLENESGYAEGSVKDYTAASDGLATHSMYLDGPWFAGSESIQACPLDERPSRIVLSCSAAEVNLVMSSAEGGEALVGITLDGKPLTGELAGEDVSRIDGESIVLVQEPRMYRLVKRAQVEPGLLELSTSTPGLEAYAFTFVSCVMND